MSRINHFYYDIVQPILNNKSNANFIHEFLEPENIYLKAKLNVPINFFDQYNLVEKNNKYYFNINNNKFTINNNNILINITKSHSINFKNIFTINPFILIKPIIFLYSCTINNICKISPVIFLKQLHHYHNDFSIKIKGFNQLKFNELLDHIEKNNLPLTIIISKEGIFIKLIIENNDIKCIFRNKNMEGTIIDYKYNINMIHQILFYNNMYHYANTSKIKEIINHRLNSFSMRNYIRKTNINFLVPHIKMSNYKMIKVNNEWIYRLWLIKCVCKIDYDNILDICHIYNLIF